MGKTTRFIKSLFGFKTTESSATQPSTSIANKQPKRRWSFVKSSRENPTRLRNASNSVDGASFHRHHHRNLNERRENGERNEDPNKSAIALAAATAAVVDAAVVAAQAAAEVVRITSRRTGYELAAVKIQSCFRAYLARRALRALKALVKLQAVVRGHLLRKQTADMMRRLQALIRAQARARARALSQISDSPTKPSSHFHHQLQGPPTPEKFQYTPHAKQDHRPLHKRNGSKSYARAIAGQERILFDGSTNHENDKIVEVDTGESYITTRRKKLFQSDQTSFGYSHSLTTSRGSTVQPTSSSTCASCEVHSIDCSIKGGPSTPIKSDCSKSCISGYSDHPNYMANTESSRAKVRSLSAPRLRSQFEISNATRDYKYGSNMQWAPTIRDNFAKKAYPGSGRLDRLGMPVNDTEENEFCVGYWN